MIETLESRKTSLCRYVHEKSQKNRSSIKPNHSRWQADD